MQASKQVSKQVSKRASEQATGKKESEEVKEAFIFRWRGGGPEEALWAWMSGAHHQEPAITPYSCHGTVSQTDLFLLWIYLEFKTPQEPQRPIAITSTD